MAKKFPKINQKTTKHRSKNPENPNQSKYKNKNRNLYTETYHNQI